MACLTVAALLVSRVAVPMSLRGGAAGSPLRERERERYSWEHSLRVCRSKPTLESCKIKFEVLCTGKPGNVIWFPKRKLRLISVDQLLVTPEVHCTLSVSVIF